MVIYVRDRDGGSQRAVSCFRYTYYTDNRHRSSFEVEGNLAAYDGGLILVPVPERGLKHASVITTITPSKDLQSTKIQTKPLVEYLDRSIEWKSAYDAQNLGAVVAACITDNWGSAQTDTAYRATWLSTSISSTDSFTKPDTDEVGLFNLKQWLLALEDAGRLFLWAKPTDSGILLTNSTPQDSRQRINFTGTDSRLESENYSDTVVAKITNHIELENEEGVFYSTDYYLFNDGTYGTDPSAGTRCRGEWKHLTNADDDKVADAFSNNKYEHKLQFTSSIVKAPGAVVLCRMNDGRVVRTIINTVCIKSTDNSIHYESGMLKTTLTDILGGLYGY